MMISITIQLSKTGRYESDCFWDLLLMQSVIVKYVYYKILNVLIKNPRAYIEFPKIKQ